MDKATSSSKTPGTRKETPYPSGDSMKAAPFEATPEFKHFEEVMRHLLVVSKKRLDELVREAKDTSPRNGDPNSPGQKRLKRRKS